MKEQIKHELARLEARLNIRILYAVESGSRAWGFASTDSDWDVRFIYIHPQDWYLSIDEKKDNIEEMLPNDLDLSGWELKKALRLFRKSNPPLLEWLRSPLVYKEEGPLAQSMRDLTKSFFNPQSCLHHYLHMAEGNFYKYLDKDIVRVKKYFYVLRPLLACEWIRNNNSMPPMEFEILLETQVQDPEIKSEIVKLLERKIKGEELNEEPKIDRIHSFLVEKLEFYKAYLETLNHRQAPDTQLLNELFIKTLFEQPGGQYLANRS
jgi:uncharacterized protein